MDKSNRSHYFLLTALITSIIVVYFIAKPFWGPLILASVCSFLFHPIYKKFLAIFRKRESLAALVTTILVIFFIVVPIFFFGAQIFRESSQLYQFLTDNGGFGELFKDTINQVHIIFPVLENFEINFDQYVKQGLKLLVENFGAVFSSFAKILLNIFVFIIVFYFFLKDGIKLKNYLIALSPLTDKQNDFILSRLKLGVSSTVKGNITIGLIQGTMTGIGFAIFGVPNPVLWGSVAVIAAFLPGIGTALVITPAVIVLFIYGNTFGGIGLLIWGITAVGLIDNLLGPKLVGKGMQLHPLAVFIAVLGGISFFGPLGFMLGPLAMSICLTLIDIYFYFKTSEN